MIKEYNIIIADDHSMFLDGLRSILSEEKNITIVLAAKTGTQVLKYLQINKTPKIDLVITDINMPEMDGITLNKAIKEAFPQVKTLVVSMLEEPVKIQQLIDAHTNGYLSKNAAKNELLKAIKTILEGENYFSSRIKNILMEALFAAKSKPLVSLTKREKEVLKLIAKEFTTKEIASQLFLSTHTIESYRKNLIAKLGVRNIAGLTRYAIEEGIL
ncbi:response regulator transcription factor [Tenacibaculum finnmarkense]|uniref:response regulator transcription factor n=1 Tax=Tenacibaculum finnmarkense TaxID=2781243 RepID=UPI000C5AF655|nr:response regulator transcription factor [Tenacibaculum finnmarkense]MBE7693214.1 response regulator [Tenacibaculum finnmarkense genomovar finnmarkense]MCD8438890.1 response regulator transcription factor [Tenacibaculum finnmarkense genomovar ulcerans]MCG8719837.1 response regulator transcription factor [Tenacibaculum finnmarkense]MCG8805838.1 response regulator transcription factor [Tenacibaculum finnmarkense]MCG8856926.1 response regulator transcription factor [Tenacibaculum finnmarkense]